jgi:hypothetical protein
MFVVLFKIGGRIACLLSDLVNDKSMMIPLTVKRPASGFSVFYFENRT